MALKKKNSLLDKIIKHTPDIIFGILAGSGLMFIVSAIMTTIIIVLPTLKPYFVIIYTLLYLFILISTSILYAKGWFRIVYLVSSLILLLTYTYTKVFGVI